MKILITGSSGLIGSEAVRFFDSLGFQVLGIDNNLRRYFFGPPGDTSWVLAKLTQECKHFQHLSYDIRDRETIENLFRRERFDCVIHCAAQPSHDWAGREPLTDFDINAAATLNLLEATRRYSPSAPFVFMSTNKVYGDVPNEIPLRELASRWEYDDDRYRDGIDETMRIDQTTHSIFGASKVAADVMVQEYGRYFGMKTVCFRGGCLTGPQHSSAELHGFLAYLAKAAYHDLPYVIYGYKGKQVRDNIHSHDVVQAFWEFIQNPTSGAVYNLGGERPNSISILEAIQILEAKLEKPLKYSYREEPRKGDHICYISNMGKFKEAYPGWKIERDLDQIFDEILATLKEMERSANV